MLKNVMVLGYLITTKFAPACKAVFPAPTATGVHRLRNNWSSMLSQLVDENTFFTSRIQVHGKGPRSIYKVQPGLGGGGVGANQFATKKFNSPF